LRRWLAELQQHWNWQAGFVDAFDPVFRSLLDVEKWWSLTVAHFTSRNPVQAWSAETALRKLDLALQPVGVLPLSGNQVVRLRLDTVINEWEFGRQLPVLRQFLRQMQVLAANSPPNVAQLALRYAGVVERYLEDRGRAGFAPQGRGQPMPTIRGAALEAVGRLRALEEARARLVAESESAAAP
jgi:hypothetical protein